MKTTNKLDTIKLSMVIGIKAPLAERDYIINDFTITISYDFSLPHFKLNNISLGQRRATFVEVTWYDDGEKIKNQLTGSSTRGDHLRPVLKALDSVNKLFLSFNLQWVGHSYSSGVRTVGSDDVWMRYCSINNQIISGLNMSRDIFPSSEDGDVVSITEKIIPHIKKDTFPVARRFIRCFELINHGFYAESLIVSFAILDDTIQTMLHAQLEKKGMTDKKQREALLRGIEKNRLKIYLGQLLYILTDLILDDIWKNSSVAIEWFNRIRNKIAHRGLIVKHGDASKAIYVSIKTLTILSENNLIDFELPSQMYRQAQIYASWTDNPPKWVPPIDEDILDSNFDMVLPNRKVTINT